MRSRASRFAFPLAALLALAACGAKSPGGEASGTDTADRRITRGLFTTLPIYWSGGDDIAAILDTPAGAGPWVREVLSDGADLMPLDTVESEALAGVSQVVMAQPRPLAPSENVALDDWVRRGGRVLLFADPMLTAHSDRPLGDPRRAHDTVVLSPILARWGLALEFDAEQPPGEQLVQAGGAQLPIDLAGRLMLRPGGEDTDCRIAAGIVAQCRVGRGRVVVIADAAVLDTESDDAKRRDAVRGLLDTLSAA